MVRSLHFFAILTGTTIGLADPLPGEDLDENWTVTINGQTSPVYPGGSFRVSNVSAPDEFGPDGPGSPRDSLSDDFLRLVARTTVGGGTRYAFSLPFQIKSGEVRAIRDLTFTDTPPPLPVSLELTAGTTALLVGESAQVSLTAVLGDGALSDVTPRTTWTTYRTTNPGVATVSRDGLVTAHNRGTVLIVATNGGATAVKRFEVSRNDVPLLVSGRVVLPDGSAAAGAIVKSSLSAAAVQSRPDGRFTLNVQATTGGTFSLTVSFEAGGRRYSAAVQVEVIEGLELLDLSAVVLREAPSDLFHLRVFAAGDTTGPAGASGDLDGDGAVDLAMAMGRIGTRTPALGVLRNRGDGTMSASTYLFNLAAPPADSLLITDLDGDGAPEVVVDESNTIEVTLNQGDGAFAPPVRYAVANAPRGLTQGDFDGDGFTDLVMVTVQNPGGVATLMNQRDGSFAGPGTFPANTPRSVVVVDSDGDGDQDLVVGNAGPGTVSVYRNVGDGTFGDQVAYPAGVNPSFVAAADLDGSGQEDLVVVNSQSPTSTVTVLLNQGDGTLAAGVTYTSGALGSTVSVGDLDGDARADLLVPSGAIVNAANANTISFHRNLGDGSFSEQVLLRVGIPIGGKLLVDDFDRDGARDLAIVPSTTYSSVCLVRNQGDGTFPANAQYPSGGGPRGLHLADFDADGIVDVAVANNNSANTISTMRGNGDGTLGSRLVDAAGKSPIDLAPTDLDGDGAVDLAVANGGEATVSILKNQGDGSFSPQVQFAAGSDLRSINAGDLDGDADMDLLVTNNLANTASILLNQGDATMAAPEPLTVGRQPLSASISDLDGDGDLDLTVGNANGNSISTLMNQGDGSFAAPIDYPVGGGAPYSLVAGDLNEDGREDLVAGCTGSTSFLSVFRNQGTGTFAPASNQVAYSAPLASSLAPVTAVMADFDRDGRPDLALSNGSHFSLAVLLNQGNESFAAPSLHGVGDRPYSMAAADLEGDGDIDLVAGNFLGATVSVLLNQAAR